MAEVKWTGKQVIDFLNLFQNYSCLWDVTSKDYLCRNVKDSAYIKLLNILKEAGLSLSLEQLKKKIKSLRDTYRKELGKIKKSQKSGAGASDIYKSKLVWFPTAEVFWHGAVTGRESSSNIEIFQLPVDESEHESSSDTNDMSENRESHVVTPRETSRPCTSRASNASLSNIKRPSTNMEPPRPKLFKMQSSNKKKPTRFESAVDKLHSIAKLTGDGTEDEYDKFGQHIASQMRQLPIRSFILLQSKFQNQITEERLKALNDNISEPLSESIFNTIEVDDPNVFNSTSNSNSNYDFENMYTEQTDNTFLDQEEDDPPSLADILSKAMVHICPDDVGC